MVMAMLDGIRNRIDPGEPLDRDIYEMTKEELRRASNKTPDRSTRRSGARGRPRLPYRGGVFTDDLVRTWIDYKRDNEIDPLRLRPHPHEFSLYFDN